MPTNKSIKQTAYEKGRLDEKARIFSMLKVKYESKPKGTLGEFDDGYWTAYEDIIKNLIA